MLQMLQKIQNNCLFRFSMFVVENINFKKKGRYSHWQCSQCRNSNPSCEVGRLRRWLVWTIHIIFLMVKGGTRSIHFGQIVSWVISEKKTCVPYFVWKGHGQPVTLIKNVNCHDELNFCLLDRNMFTSLCISHTKDFYKYHTCPYWADIFALKKLCFVTKTCRRHWVHEVTKSLCK